MREPCDNCPFTRDAGAIRLRAGRVRQLTGNALDPHGGSFPCHKTVEHGDDGEEIVSAKQKECAGSIIFSEQHDTATQMMRVLGRIGVYNPSDLRGHDRVFATVEEMLATALDAPDPRPRSTRCRGESGAMKRRAKGRAFPSKSGRV